MTTSPTKTKPITFKQAFKDFIVSKRRTGAAPLTCQRYEAWLQLYPFDELTPKSVDLFTAQLLERPIGNAMRNNYLKALRSFGAWAVERGHLTSNPVKPSKWTNEKADRPVITEAEYALLLAEARKHKHEADSMVYGVAMGWHLGMRLGDVCMLQWEALDLDQRVMSLLPNKTKRHGKRVEVPYGAEVAESLARLAGLDAVFVSPYLAEGYKRDPNWAASLFKRLSVRAGVKKSHHCLRHSAITRMLERGISAELVTSITGQSLYTVMSYLHVSMAKKREILGIPVEQKREMMGLA